jgi:hypothetical protein
MVRVSLAQTGYVGYPYRIFLEMTNYGRGTQTHLEKMVILEKWYSHLRACLPIVYEDKKKLPEYETDIAPLLMKVYDQIEAMNQQYDPTFESLESCNPDEKIFVKTMRGVFERLDVITAKTKLIDKQKGDEDGVDAG